jgi:hypothetical protein
MGESTAAGKRWLRTVRVVATGQPGLCEAVKEGLPSTIRILQVPTWMTNYCEDGDHCVLDLLRIAGPLDDPAAALRATRSATLWLLIGDFTVRSEWLRIPRQAQVRLLSCNRRERATGFPTLLSRLNAELAVPTGEQVYRLVMRSAPFLSTVSSLLLALYLNPWGIRRPRDLAHSTDSTIFALRSACHRAGFKRVEHFLIYARSLAVECLVRERTLSVAAARRRLGIDDTSNMRRQIARAYRGSADVFDALDQGHLGSMSEATRMHNGQRQSRPPWNTLAGEIS